jgi:hypothetical protein
MHTLLSQNSEVIGRDVVISSEILPCHRGEGWECIEEEVSVAEKKNSIFRRTSHA